MPMIFYKLCAKVLICEARRVSSCSRPIMGARPLALIMLFATLSYIPCQFKFVNVPRF